jgi:catechol 2,3-dioxygenase-like lactoylglutathione lyase family enzyme
MPTEPGEPPNEDHFAFKAVNVDEAWAELKRQGIEMLLEPRDYDWGRSAYLRDPDGRLVEIH